MKKILLSMVVSLIVFTASSQTFTSVMDGNWSSPATWGGAVPPAEINSGQIVNVRNRVIYDISSDLKVLQGAILNVGTTPAGGGDTLRFNNVASASGTGKSLVIEPGGILTVLNGGVILPLLLSNGVNNNGNIENKGTVTFLGSLAEVAQNWQGLGSGSIRDFRNSCLRAGEGFKNEGLDTYIGVCIEIAQHGSGNFDNTGVMNVRTTSVLFRGTSGNFSNSSSGIIQTFGGAGVGFQAINITGGGNLVNSGTWNTQVLYWCTAITDPPSGTYVPALPAENCGFFTANNNFFSSCRDCSPQNTALPVTFKYFTASRNNASVIVKWETASEQNNSGFAVERNINGTWEQIAFVPSQAVYGNSVSTLRYQYIDPNNTKGITQYRIKQVDLNAKSKYSEIRSVRGDGQMGKTIVYPNPSNDGKVNIVFENANVSRDISVLDMSGRTVKQMRDVTNNNITIENLTPGIYSLRIMIPATGEQTVEKIVVNK